MIIGMPRETKSGEERVALTPSCAGRLRRAGHSVLVERSAGKGAGFSDADYLAAGALLSGTDQVFSADIIVKVKEPNEAEAARLRGGQVLFCYLHLAGVPHLVRPLLASGVTAIGFETVEDDDGRRPLLHPMSLIAGRLAPQIGAHFLERPNGGRGILLGGFDAGSRGTTLVIGAGIVGQNAAKIARGLGSKVLVYDVHEERARSLQRRIQGVQAVPVGHLFQTIAQADLVIGAAYVSGERAPKVAGFGEIGAMRPGSVIVDVSIDQGGCFETSRVTFHKHPTFVELGVIHYCVPNVPSLVSNTATNALSKAIEPYLLMLASSPEGSLERDTPLGRGVNIAAGKVVHPGVVRALEADRACRPLQRDEL